jgi:hypothetical protein
MKPLRTIKSFLSFIGDMLSMDPPEVHRARQQPTGTVITINVSGPIDERALTALRREIARGEFGGRSRRGARI